MRTSAASRYQSERVMTATPGELIAMLYDAAVMRLNRALDGLREGNHEDVSRDLLRAQDIVGELRCSLDLDAEPIGKSLDALYGWAYLRLVHANIKRDPIAVSDVLKVIEPLQEAWREACLTANASVPAAAHA